MLGVFILNNADSFEVINLCNLTILVHSSIVHLLYIKRELIYEIHLNPTRKFYFYRYISAGRNPLRNQGVEWVLLQNHSAILPGSVYMLYLRGKVPFQDQGAWKKFTPVSGSLLTIGGTGSHGLIFLHVSSDHELSKFCAQTDTRYCGLLVQLVSNKEKKNKTYIGEIHRNICKTF